MDEAIPVEVLPVEPVPVEAIPVDSFPPPLPASFPPAWPATYGGPVRLGPPGIVRAVGICSIIVAALGLVGGGVTTLGSLFSYTISAAQAARSNATMAAQAAAAPAASGGPAEVVGIGGMAAADRLAVADGLNRARPLTPGQLLQLDELLATDGKTVVNTAGPPDAAVVEAGVTASGPIGSLGNAAAVSPRTPSYYVLSTGRLTVSDDGAAFFPNDGQPNITAAAYPLPPPPPNAAPPPLNDEAMRSVLRAVTRRNGSRPKSAQVKAIVDLLRTPTQQIVVPTPDGTDPAAKVTAANTDTADGTLTVTTQRGTATCTLSVTPDGKSSADVLAGISATVPPPNAMALRAVLFTSMGQLALAVYLLVIGIATVRQSRRGRLLHWVYVGLKVPVAVAAIVAAGWLWGSLASSASSTPTAFSPWAVPAVIGLIYPVVLVFVLASRGVRDYYRTAA